MSGRVQGQCAVQRRHQGALLPQYNSHLLGRILNATSGKQKKGRGVSNGLRFCMLLLLSLAGTLDWIVRRSCGASRRPSLSLGNVERHGKGRPCRVRLPRRERLTRCPSLRASNGVEGLRGSCQWPCTKLELRLKTAVVVVKNVLFDLRCQRESTWRCGRVFIHTSTHQLAMSRSSYDRYLTVFSPEGRVCAAQAILWGATVTETSADDHSVTSAVSSRVRLQGHLQCWYHCHCCQG